MIEKNAPIGVMDSGVGGLTVVRELQCLMPEEDILFFGDSANCPYGNRSGEEIFTLSRRMLKRLEEQGVKCVVIACNTISAAAERLRKETNLQVFSIVESACGYIKAEGLAQSGLLATARTVESGIYERCLRETGAHCRLVAQASPALAAIIEHGDYDGAAAEEEIKRQIAAILARERVSHVIFGCTHYPIARGCFQRCFPELTFLDPARMQAEAVAGWLAEQDGQRRGGGRLTIATTAGEKIFARICRELGIQAAEIAHVESFEKQSAAAL